MKIEYFFAAFLVCQWWSCVNCNGFATKSEVRQMIRMECD